MYVMCSQRPGSGGRSPGSFSAGGTTGSSDSSEIRDSTSLSRPFFLEGKLYDNGYIHPCEGFEIRIKMKIKQSTSFVKS